jgi:integrase
MECTLVQGMEAGEEIAALMAERDRFCSALMAQNTYKSYDDSWGRFTRFCEGARRVPLPASSETVALWAVSMLRESKRVTTVQARLSGVAHHHKIAGFPSPIGPEVRAVLNGARRLRKENARQKRALSVKELWKVCRVIDTTTAKGLRDRAIIVLGFAGAFRRSELSNLDVSDITFVPKGLLIHLRWSKTDQEGEGRDVGLFRGDNADTCPVRTLKAWLDRRGRHPGPLFLAVTGRGDEIRDERLKALGIVEAVKRGVKRIGLDPHQYAGHSLRAGFCTAAAENGASEIAIMQRTGHKSVQMVHRYVRPVSVFSVNPLFGKL